MNLSELSKIDIKNVDFNKLKDQLLERQDLLIQGGLVVISLIVILSMFSNGQIEVRKYKSQITGLKSKTGAITDYNKAREDASVFLKGVPAPLTEDQIISFITDLADKNNINILTISPSKTEDKEVLTTTTLQFSLETMDYKDMVRFIAGIEHSKSLLQIKSCVAQTQTGMENKAKKNDSQTISFRIEVVSVQVKI